MKTYIYVKHLTKTAFDLYFDFLYSFRNSKFNLFEYNFTTVIFVFVFHLDKNVSLCSIRKI